MLFIVAIDSSCIDGREILTINTYIPLVINISVLPPSASDKAWLGLHASF